MCIAQSAAIEAQAQKVRMAYARTGSVNPEYEVEFATLQDMKKVSMATDYRKARGLHAYAKTPYCPRS
jgi:hypothetical protein